MALDIFLINNQKDINKETPHFAFKEDDFEKMIELAKPLENFVTINKISDYYSDNILYPSDIKKLVSELEILNDNKEFSSLIDFLNSSKNINAFIFSD